MSHWMTQCTHVSEITLQPISTYNYNLSIKYQVKLFWKKIQRIPVFCYHSNIKGFLGERGGENMLLHAHKIWNFLGLLQADQVLQESTGETTSGSSYPLTLSFLPNVNPLSSSFLEVYFFAYFSILTEHVLHPVLSLVIYSSSWEKTIQRWSYIIYIMFNVFILLKTLLVSRFSPS